MSESSKHHHLQTCECPSQQPGGAACGVTRLQGYLTQWFPKVPFLLGTSKSMKNPEAQEATLLVWLRHALRERVIPWKQHSKYPKPSSGWRSHVHCSPCSRACPPGPSEDAH